MAVASRDAKRQKDEDGADWEENFAVGMATEAAGVVGLLTGLFSKKTRRAVIGILLMPTSLYGFFLFIFSKFGCVNKIIISRGDIDVCSIFPTVSSICSSGTISSYYREVFSSQITINGLSNILYFIAIPFVVFLCGDRLLLERKKNKPR